MVTHECNNLAEVEPPRCTSVLELIPNGSDSWWHASFPNIVSSNITWVAWYGPYWALANFQCWISFSLSPVFLFCCFVFLSLFLVSWRGGCKTFTKTLCVGSKMFSMKLPTKHVFCEEHAELWLSRCGRGPASLYFSQVQRGTILYAKAWEPLTNTWLEATEDSERKDIWWFAVGMKLVTKKPVSLRGRWEIWGRFSLLLGVVKLIAWRSVEEKGTPRNQMQCHVFWSVSRGWRKGEKVISPQVQQEDFRSMRKADTCLFRIVR